MIPVHSAYTIKLGLFQQRGGWVFIGTTGTFYDQPLFSGKRRTLYDAIEAAKGLAPADSFIVYSMLDNKNDWTD